MYRSSNRTLLAALLAAASLLAVVPSAAAARQFGPMIDRSGAYDGQRKCDPDAEPGVLAFRKIVLRRFPWSGPGGIGRSCSIGGQSEHKEGRAWDWMVDVGVRRERRAANTIINWLQREDSYGNDAALARRFGVMYLIWNRKFWSPDWGWSTYCVQKKRGCVDPDDGDIKHPHTNHVHFSFTWAGAKKRTTYWHRDRTYVVSAAAAPGNAGHWYVGGNGEVRSSGDTYGLGSASIPLHDKAVDVTAHPEGWGYWVLSRSGRIHPFGGADDLGRGRGTFRAMAASHDGTGYWLLSVEGRVVARGGAAHLGDVDARGRDISASPTGAGYWILTKGGRVVPFGDAVGLGGIAGSGSKPAALAPTPTGLGYFVATRDGRVFAFGDAVKAGDLGGRSGRPMVAMMVRPDGYTLINDKGRAFRF